MTESVGAIRRRACREGNTLRKSLAGVKVETN